MRFPSFLLLAFFTHTAFSLDVQCPSLTALERLEQSDIVFIGKIDTSSEEESGFESFHVKVYRLWKGEAQRDVRVLKNSWLNEIEESQYYLFFLSLSENAGIYYRRPCQYADQVLYSGEAIVELGDPIWSFSDDEPAI